MLHGENDLLSLLPASAYRVGIGHLGYTRRSIVVVNDPALVRTVLLDAEQIYPKSDLMVDALDPLVGDSIFVSSGPTWRTQRDMIDPGFTHIRLGRAFASMTAAVERHCAWLDGLAKSRGEASLDLAMSELTADIICRTVFSTSLDSDVARDVCQSFGVFERSVAQVKFAQLIFGAPFSKARQRPDVLAACARIRGRLGELLADHLADPERFDDIASAMVGARDAQSGRAFSPKELIDQLGVFFLAGHETTASTLTWAFFILSQQPEVVSKLRREVSEVCGVRAVVFDDLKDLKLTRSIFRETMRLYPPITFLPRVALRDAQLGSVRIRRGAMVMISPWTIHRHQSLWSNPHSFDAERFLPEREGENPTGAYLPFGIGPRVCAGAAFAQSEATLILAELWRRFDFSVGDPERVRPVARLTTRPAEPIHFRVRPYAG